MNRMTWMVVLVTCWLAVCLRPATAAEAVPDVLTAVPANAWAVMCVRNIGEFDRKIQTLEQQLNTPPMSPLEMAKATFGMLSGLDDTGAVAVVVLPVGNPMDPAEWMRRMAVLVPCQDFASLTGMMQPEDAGDGLSRFLLMGEESYIAVYGRYAAISRSADALKSLLTKGDDPGVGKSWSQHQLQRFAADDVTLWINLDGIITSPPIQTMLAGIAAMSGASLNTQEVNDYKGLSIALRLEKSGLYLGMHTAMKDGSASAKLIASSPATAKSLLTGLPREQFLLAAGAESSGEQAAKFAEAMGQVLGMAVVQPTLARHGQEKSDQVKRAVETITGLFGDMRGLSFSISTLPPGPEGLVGLAKVATLEGDAAGKCAKFAELVEIISSFAPPEEAEEVRNVVKYVPGAETIDGVSIDHLAVHVDQMKSVTEDDFRKVTKIVGKEGILIRIAAVDDRHIAATFGGGGQRMNKVIELVRTNSAPLSADETIKRVAATLPSERDLEGYLAVDRIWETATAIAKALDQPEEVPFGLPQINAPVAMVAGPVSGGSYQMDLALPMELIVVVKDVVMNYSAGGLHHTPPAGSGPGS